MIGNIDPRLPWHGLQVCLRNQDAMHHRVHPLLDIALVLAVNRDIDLRVTLQHLHFLSLVWSYEYPRS